jgi:hypothetical protein
VYAGQALTSRYVGSSILVRHLCAGDLICVVWQVICMGTGADNYANLLRNTAGRYHGTPLYSLFHRLSPYATTLCRLKPHTLVPY